MVGVILACCGSVFRELADSIGKVEMRDGVVSHYSFGFLNLLFGTLFLVGYGLFFDGFRFSLASLPTFLLRVPLDILQAHIGVLAVLHSDRSDFGFVRMLTIPLLVAVDIWLGYSVSAMHLVGIGLILGSVVILIVSEGMRTKGMWLLLISAVNAVFTLSLYKYDITHFNSVAAEQSLIALVLMVYFFAAAKIMAKENPFTFLRRKALAGQAAASGLGDVMNSFAYAFAPAGVVVAAYRASALVASVISGRMYFRERRTVLKLVLVCVTVSGLTMLALGGR